MQSNESSSNNENDAEDNDDACFLFGPVLTLGDGVIMEGAGGEGEGCGWDGGHDCGLRYRAKLWVSGEVVSIMRVKFRI